jgi:hypothetical protein
MHLPNEESFDSLEVDKSALHIGVHQLHANPLTHVDPLETLRQFPLNWRMKQADPGALGGGAGDEGLEAFPDSGFEQYGRCGFFELPFHLSGGILSLRAVLA